MTHTDQPGVLAICDDRDRARYLNAIRRAGYAVGHISDIRVVGEAVEEHLCGIVVLDAQLITPRELEVIRTAAPACVVVAARSGTGGSIADFVVALDSASDVDSVLRRAAVRHELLLEYHERDRGFRVSTLRPVTIADLERQHIEHVLDRMGWNISKSARLLDIDRATLYNKIRKYGLERPVP